MLFVTLQKMERHSSFGALLSVSCIFYQILSLFPTFQHSQLTVPAGCIPSDIDFSQEQHLTIHLHTNNILQSCYVMCQIQLDVVRPINQDYCLMNGCDYTLYTFEKTKSILTALDPRTSATCFVMRVEMRHTWATEQDVCIQVRHYWCQQLHSTSWGVGLPNGLASAAAWLSMITEQSAELSFFACLETLLKTHSADVSWDSLSAESHACQRLAGKQTLHKTSYCTRTCPAEQKIQAASQWLSKRYLQVSCNTHSVFRIALPLEVGSKETIWKNQSRYASTPLLAGNVSFEYGLIAETSSLGAYQSLVQP